MGSPSGKPSDTWREANNGLTRVTRPSARILADPVQNLKKNHDPVLALDDSSYLDLFVGIGYVDMILI